MKGLTLGGLALATSLIVQSTTPQNSISEMTQAEIHDEFTRVCADKEIMKHVIHPEIMCEYSPDEGNTWILYAGSIAGIITLMLGGVVLVRIYRKKEGASTPEVPPLFTTQNIGAPKTRSAVLPSKFYKEPKKSATAVSTPVQKIDEAVLPAQIEHTVGDTMEGETSTKEGNSLTPGIQSFVRPEDEQGFNNFLSDLGVGNDNANGVAIEGGTGEEGNIPISQLKPHIQDVASNTPPPTVIHTTVEEVTINNDPLKETKPSKKFKMNLPALGHIRKRGTQYSNKDGVITLQITKEGSKINRIGENIQSFEYGEAYIIIGAIEINLLEQGEDKTCIEVVYEDSRVETLEIVG